MHNINWVLLILLTSNGTQFENKSGTSTGLQLKLFTFHSLREQSEPQHGLQEQRLRKEKNGKTSLLILRKRGRESFKTNNNWEFSQTKEPGTSGSGRSGRLQWSRLAPVPWTCDTSPGGTPDTCAGGVPRWCRSHPAGRALQTASASSLCSRLSAPTGRLQGRRKGIHRGVNRVRWHDPLRDKTYILTWAISLCIPQEHNQKECRKQKGISWELSHGEFISSDSGKWKHWSRGEKPHRERGGSHYLRLVLQDLAVSWAPRVCQSPKERAAFITRLSAISCCSDWTLVGVKCLEEGTNWDCDSFCFINPTKDF